MSGPLDNSRLKIKRAQTHVVELHRVFSAFAKTDFYRLVVETDAEKRRLTVRCEITEKLPEDVPLIIGEALQNLRTAFDYAYIKIVQRAGGATTKHTKFPFGHNGFVGTTHGRQIQALSDEILRLIVDAADPNKGRDHPFYAFNEMAIEDRHIDLLPIISVFAVSNVGFIEVMSRIVVRDFYLAFDGDRATFDFVMPYSADADLKITNEGHPSFSVLFGQGQIFEGQPVIPSLAQLAQFVSGAIDALEKALVNLDAPAHAPSSTADERATDETGTAPPS